MNGFGYRVSSFLLHLVCVVCVYVCVYDTHAHMGGKGITCKSQLSSFTLWGSDIKLRLSGLIESVFIHQPSLW